MIKKLFKKLFKKNKISVKNIEFNSMLLRNGIESTFSDLTFTPLMYLDALEDVLKDKNYYPIDVVKIAIDVNIKDVYNHLDNYEKFTSNCCSGGYSKKTKK
jgi:hypothetical protein